ASGGPTDPGYPTAGYPTGSAYPPPPPGYQGGGYGYPPGGPPPAKGGNGLAIGALVCGILALLTFWSIIGGIGLGLVAVVLGFMARRKAKAGLAGGAGMALGGIITGILAMLLSVGLLAGIGAALSGKSGAELRGKLTEFQQCMADAGDDRAAQERCQQQLPTAPPPT
ncbi:MAG: DUF4190 domain-containing protein, partial [Actinomycetota bacterium]|nr:DUF4190 domain-containing protein [Actinomycetota bacterium]